MNLTQAAATPRYKRGVWMAAGHLKPEICDPQASSEIEGEPLSNHSANLRGYCFGLRQTGILQAGAEGYGLICAPEHAWLRIQEVEAAFDHAPHDLRTHAATRG